MLTGEPVRKKTVLRNRGKKESGGQRHPFGSDTQLRKKERKKRW